MCEVLAEPEDDVISVARATKDAQEVTCIRRTCRLTIGETRDYLRGHRLVGKTLYTLTVQPLTAADVKRFICVRAFALMCNCIFAIGRDAGFSHSSETPEDPITVGKTIIFDIFPRGLGGYHCDITRTCPLGHAPAHVEQAHALAEARFNTEEHTCAFNEAACDLFEANG